MSPELFLVFYLLFTYIIQSFITSSCYWSRPELYSLMCYGKKKKENRTRTSTFHALRWPHNQFVTIVVKFQTSPCSECLLNFFLVFYFLFFIYLFHFITSCYWSRPELHSLFFLPDVLWKVEKKKTGIVVNHRTFLSRVSTLKT